MKGPAKRSVSPFGTPPDAADDGLSTLAEAFAAAFGPPPQEVVRKFTSAAHLPGVPGRIRKAAVALANDLPWLDDFCAYLVRMRPDMEEKKVSTALWEAMERLFDRKTELFLVDRVDEGEERRNRVLFARERDTLVGRFFAGWTEREPGLFSAFVTRWTESQNPDRILHFLDFCAGSKNPTFEHYLLFTHPALDRWVSNKAQLRSLFARVQPVLTKMASPTWEHDVRGLLGI